jgi:hypothetical protein
MFRNVTVAPMAFLTLVDLLASPARRGAFG